MSDNRKAFEKFANSKEWSLSKDSGGDYINSAVYVAYIAWQAATEQSSKEIERLNALVAMKDEALKFYADGCHFVQHQDVWESVSGEPENFLEDENNTATVEDGSIAKHALSTSSESLAAWEAEKLLPLQRQVAMQDKNMRQFCSTVSEYLLFTAKSTDLAAAYHYAYESLSNTQATAEAYDREHAEKVLEEALDICESEANEPNEGMSDFADGYDAACKEIREQIKHRIAELRATKQVKE